MPVSQANVEKYGEDWANSPETYVCNGPFMLADMKKDESYTLVKNPNYYNADEVQIDTVNYVFLNAPETVKMAFDNGELDIATSVNSDALKAYTGTDKLMSSDRIGYRYYEFNCSKEPFNDARVRRALTLALNRKIITEGILQDATLPQLYGWVPYGIKDIVDPTQDWRDVVGNAFEENVEEAKALLAEAGYPNGEGFPTVQLSFYSDDNVKKIAEAIAEMWQTNLGIQVEVTSSDWAVFYDAVQAGEYDVAAMGWSADYVNPMSFLPLLYTDDVSNNVFYSNKDYDAVVDQIKVEKDSTKFAELVMQADEIASNEYPVLPLYYKSNNYLLKDYVKGVYMTSSSNIYFKDAQVLAH